MGEKLNLKKRFFEYFRQLILINFGMQNIVPNCPYHLRTYLWITTSNPEGGI